MSSLNKVILIGRVTKDAELRYTPNGTPVASFGLAVNRPGKPGTDRANQETDFFDIVVWQQRAEPTSKYVTKGRLVAVEGKIRTRSYETQDGQKRKAWEIVADDIRYLGPGRDARGSDAVGFEQGPGMENETTPPREPVYSHASSDKGSSGTGFEEDIPF